MPPIYVYLWFDIEDYVSRESDDLPLTAFRILDKYGVRATCKIVAEKIRILEENNRKDIISAISRHDVGYHLDTHSRHPTLYEYLADLDVRSGAEEFYEREHSGLEELARVFSRNPSCFGHPGPTWAPQVYPALTRMNIPVYLDETPILNLRGQPYWYCGLLNLNGANENFISFDYTFEKATGITEVKRRFKKIHDRLQKSGGGAVSVLFHLHTAINRKFWDEVNFGNGTNIPREAYRRPPAQPPEITQRAWKNFDELIGYISSFEDVIFITASDATRIYQRSRHVTISRKQLTQVARHFRVSTGYFEKDGSVMSPAEAFYALTTALVAITSGSFHEEIELREPLGPLAPFRSIGKRTLQTRDLIESAKLVVNYISREEYLPSNISIGTYTVLSPEDFLATVCKLLLVLVSGKPMPQAMSLSRGRPPDLKCINAANFRKACKWKVLPRNFRAPKILQQIRLQAWTLRPAVAASPPESDNSPLGLRAT